MKSFGLTLLMLSLFAASAFAGVTVSSPLNNQTYSGSIHYVAAATTTTCSKGVASMGVYVNNKLIYVSYGTKLDTTLPMNPGKYGTVVEEWDYCGGATYTLLTVTVTAQPGIWIGSPAANSTVSSPVSYVATATTTSCARGVASMGVYVNNKLVYVEKGTSLNTQIALEPGAQHTVIEQWDYCGGASYTPVNVNVVSNEHVLSNLQNSPGWNSWGQGAPNYVDCSPSPCSGYQFSHTAGMKSPSLSGNATQFTLGGPQGTKPYGDVLFSLPLLGQFSTQGLPDTEHTLIPSIHNFTYDAYFYVTNAPITQVLEFDISMYLNSTGMIFGTQCRIAGGNEWDIWDNVNAHWVPSGVPCNPANNGWNHVTIQVQRQADNSLLYQSITLNGSTATINKTYAPFSVPESWYGVTVNYQMDGNAKQAANVTYLDNFSLTYW
jgi:hypothetical protein